MRMAIAVGVGVGGALLASGPADAQIEPLRGASALPRAVVSLPSVGVSLPDVNVGLPEVDVSLPSVGLSLSGVSVSTPAATVTGAAGVSVPSVTVSTPALTVTTPEVKVSTAPVSVSSTPVTVSTPSQPGETKTESPHAGTPTSPRPGGSGGTSGGSSSSTDAGHGTTATAAAVGATAGAASASTAAPGAGSDDRRATRRRGALPRRSGSRGAAGPSRAGAPGSSAASGATPASDPGALRTSTSAPGRAETGANHHRTSDPLDAIGRHIPLPIPVPDWSKPIILVLLALAVWFAARSRISARRARRLERQRATLLRDVDVMQAALVPEIPARVGGAAVSVAYRPAEGPAAGGDFYDVFVPAPGSVALILGDVAGHGHEALTQAALMRYTLRAYLQAGLEPRAALALAGRVLADSAMEHFATVVVGVYDTGEGRLTYASAGHPAPILLGLQTREPLAVCASPPIGWTVPTGRRQTTVSLPRGAVACFFSDGLLEARCEDGLLGEERLGEIVAELGPRPDAETLLACVRAAALATPDDMAACILVPQLAGVAPRIHVEELEADAEMLARGQLRRFLEACLLPAAAVDRALEEAGEITALCGTALARAELAPRSATVTVTAPPPSTQAEIAAHTSQPAGQPSGAG
jgi:hypothetical protein